VAVVAGSAAAILVRRRLPLVCFVIIGVCSLGLVGGLDSGQHATVNGVYGVVIPLYAVARWATRRTAWVASLVWVALAEIVVAVRGPTLATAVGPLLAGAVAFTAGAIVRTQLALMRSLRETASQLADERRDRERLAVASERARLTRALQLAVAEGVEAMVVQAQAALTLLEAGPAGEDCTGCADAMSAVETTGRDVLTQLRHILGVLRHGGVAADVAPQPGVDRIHELVDAVRANGRLVDLSVEGDPGTLVAGIDLATYRILEAALKAGPRMADAAIVVKLRFTPTDVELRVTDPACSFPTWSAPALEQRVAMFRGEIGISPVGTGTEVSVRLPRRTEAMFV
jgi:signal transduction histidine kinase